MCSGLDDTKCAIVGYFTYVHPSNCVGALVYSSLYGTKCTVGYFIYVKPRKCVGALVYREDTKNKLVGYTTYVQPHNFVGALVYSELDGTQCTVGFFTYEYISQQLFRCSSVLWLIRYKVYSGLLYLCTTPQLCRCFSVQWTRWYTVYSGLLYLRIYIPATL